MYVTSLQNCQKTNETITFFNNHFCKNCTWPTSNHSKDHKKKLHHKNRIYLHEIKGQGRRRYSWAALAAVAGGVLGVRWSSLSSSSGGTVVVVVVVAAIKSELKKEQIFEYPEEYLKNIQYPKNI